MLFRLLVCIYFTQSLRFSGSGDVPNQRYWMFVRGSRKFPIHVHSNPGNTKLSITCLQMVQMTSYLHHNTRTWRETFPDVLVKIRHDDVILRHMTSFSCILSYYDVIDKNADVNKNNVKVIIANKRTNVTLLPCNTPSPLRMYEDFDKLMLMFSFFFIFLDISFPRKSSLSSYIVNTFESFIHFVNW